MDFSLIETLRWEPGTGFVRLPLHLERLKASAEALGFPGAEGAERALLAAVSGDEPLRVRLELFPNGGIDVMTAPHAALPADTVWTVKMARTRLRSDDTLLRHKTSRRDVYAAARAEYARDEADEVLLLNEKGELCEGTITNLFIGDATGRLLTPPLSAGLLEGVLRTELIRSGQAREQCLRPEDICDREVFIGNSLRGLVRAHWRK
ncbi:aminotransferase class IV family protein [Rhizobium sp. NRK18]|uniref:aminotransferase class IV family protein n=1 Tax=Rhizobium sp. NRK18 TaxID=2964667 RepID=UPI0021C4078B|nr:aminotransferase class IV family protein [Rhizobium sp. NRK18]MCQ2002775.1 aminotransferase class IV family protein [Rhizobium sp. NRK18]